MSKQGDQNYYTFQKFAFNKLMLLVQKRDTTWVCHAPGQQM